MVPFELDLEGSFPYDRYKRMLPNQREAFEILGRVPKAIIEMPTGTGKTAIGYTFLKALEKQGKGPLFYVTPTKTLVDQVKKLHPDVKVAYGRSEYDCFYYEPEQKFRADQIPCSLLTDCPHRVDQTRGETLVGGVLPCPYLGEKFFAKQGGIIVCTTAFYLFTQLFSREWDTPAGLVIDEAHRIAHVARSCLSYEISDYHLRKAVELLQDIGAEEADSMRGFLNTMIRIVKRKPMSASTLLESHEVQELIDHLTQINGHELRRKIGAALRSKGLNMVERREVLKKLEVVTHDLTRYVRSFEFSLPTPDRKPLNYTYAYYTKELRERERAQYRIFIKAYYVAPIIQKLLSTRTLAFSATIGNPDVFGFETGIKAPFYSLGSDFPVENTRIYLPTDTPNLALKSRGKREPTKVLRTIAHACRRLANSEIRSLVIVVSNKERTKFLTLCEEEKVDAVSYGNGTPAREVARSFMRGKGSVLVGTVAHYGEGIDLPKQLAPVIFFLRPGYPSPSDPGTVFEERRFGGMRWRVWNWRVMIEALQARGRNVRSTTDRGVTFFISQQFRRFVRPTLPEWLQAAYQGDKTFEECLRDARKLLGGRT